MNEVFEQVEKYMLEALNTNLPDVSMSDLEKDGAIFYMNGKNGTEHDWYVNEHLPSFFIFYNDEENLGAVKANLYTDGGMTVYVYGDRGHGEPIQLEYTIDADQERLSELAAILTKNVDEKCIWDEDIRILDADGKPDAQTFEQFKSSEKDHEEIKQLRDMMGQTVLVSKKVREEGWKIGYGYRDDPTNERDSGWYFCVGDESEEYTNNPENLELWLVNSALNYDPALNKFITSPSGTAIVRVSSDEFELDEEGKEIFFEKRTN